MPAPPPLTFEPRFSHDRTHPFYSCHKHKLYILKLQVERLPHGTNSFSMSYFVCYPFNMPFYPFEGRCSTCFIFLTAQSYGPIPVWRCRDAGAASAVSCGGFLAAGHFLEVMERVSSCFQIRPSSCNRSTRTCTNGVAGAHPC